MYFYFLIPSKIVIRAEEKGEKSKDCYINKERLRELQLVELEILKEIDRICKEESLTYYLGEGTLLGAIRHQGFIPWDDDLDILMPRRDYEKFLNLVSDKLSNKYKCLNERIDNSYYLPFSKIISLDNHGFVNVLDKFEDQYSGPFVDIFPLDYCNTNDKQIITRKYTKIRRLRDKLLLKANYIQPRTMKQKVYKVLSDFSKNEKLHAYLQSEMIYDDESADYVCNFASSYHPSKQIVAKTVYGEPKYVPFEDGLFPVPHDTHELLSSIYGNYMHMPLVMQRVCKHSFFDAESILFQKTTKPIEAAEKKELFLAEIKRLQQLELGILKEVDRVCREYNIKYYLVDDTLLGAIRHQGFIPWHTEVEIAMPREEFENFMSICDEALDSRHKFQYYNNIETYWDSSAKVRLIENTEFVQSKFLKFTNDVGPYINILPLDYVSDSWEETMKQSKIIKRYKRILSLKTKIAKPKRKLDRVFVIYSKFYCVKEIHEKIIKKSKENNEGAKNYFGNFSSRYNIKKEMFPMEAFGEPIYMIFEDMEFPVPHNYQLVLEKIYGDYMKLPPKSKQIAKHSFE